MQALIGETLVAEADADRLVQIEGSLYFPPDSVRWEFLEDSATPYTCPWKGTAQYWNVWAATGTHVNTAWSYPSPRQSAVAHVGIDFTDFVAFDPIQVVLLESRGDMGML